MNIWQDSNNTPRKEKLTVEEIKDKYQDTLTKDQKHILSKKIDIDFGRAKYSFWQEELAKLNEWDERNSKGNKKTSS